MSAFPPDSMSRFLKTPWPAVLLAFLSGMWGLGWGLPSAERNALFLSSDLRTPEFYQKVDQARAAHYEKIGLNPIAHLGRMSRSENALPETHDFLAAYSSFLVRSHHGDEQQALVMVSRLNPLKGRWYPYTFQYGGAYIYPLAAYLGTLHALRFITLQPQAAFYYEHPEKIADIYGAVRIWSVLGLMFSAVWLFYIGRIWGGPPLGLWASCFYVLTPAAMAASKLAKPHVWAAAWILASIYFCLKTRTDQRLRILAAAAFCFGLGVGTAMSQIVFLPILVWACVLSREKPTILSTALALLIAAAAFLVSNFYLFNHAQDYRDEVFYFSQYYPFDVHLKAIWNFWVGVLLPSLGIELFVLSFAGLGFAMIQNKDVRFRVLAVLSVTVFIFVAFQVQSMPGEASASRLCLAAIGIVCLTIGWFPQKWPRANALCGILLVILSVKAAVYNMHFVSDQAPRDNASLAGLWIQEHLPAGARLGHTQSVPHVIEFPPIDFARYKLVTISSSDNLPDYAVLPDWAHRERRQLLEKGYVPLKRFAESPLQKLGYNDRLTTANFPLEIYKKKD
jgi:hypothetical protein